MQSEAHSSLPLDPLISISISTLVGDLQYETELNCQETASSFVARIRQAHKFHIGPHFLSLSGELKGLTSECLGSIVAEKGIAKSIALSITKVPRIVVALPEQYNVQVYSIVNGELLRTLNCNCPSFISACEFSPDASLLIGRQPLFAEAFLWDIQTGVLLHTFKNVHKVTDMHFSRDSALLVLLGSDHVPRIFDVQTKTCVFPLRTYSSAVGCSPDKALLSTVRDHVLQIWQFETGTWLRNLWLTPLHEASFTPRWFTSDWTLVSLPGDPAKVWNVQTGVFFEGGDCLKVSPDGAIIGAYRDAGLALLDTDTGTCLRILPTNEKLYEFSPDGAVIATFDGLVANTWDVQSGCHVGTCKPDKPDITNVWFSKDSASLVIYSKSLGRDGSFSVWDVQTRTCFHSLCGGWPLHMVDSTVTSMIIGLLSVLDGDTTKCYRLGNMNYHFVPCCTDVVECVLAMSSCDARLDWDVNMTENKAGLGIDTEQDALQTGVSESSSFDTFKVVSSSVSVIGSEPAWFTIGTSFRDGFGFRKDIESLGANDTLLAVDGSKVKVASIRRCRNMDQGMVFLRTSSCQLILMHDQHVTIVCGDPSKQRPIPAGHLEEGDHVLLADCPQAVSHIEHFFGDVDCFEMVLEHDIEIEAFYRNVEDEQAISTKGTPVRASTSRRGIMCKPSSPSPACTLA